VIAETGSILTVWDDAADSYNEPMSEYRTLIEGVYELKEWSRSGETFVPPQAAGRVVYMHGTVTLVMRCNGGNWENHRYGIGRYVIEGDRLLYGYDRMFDFTRDENGYRVTPEAVNGNLRPYRLRMADGLLLCDGETHGTGMRFAADHLKVMDGGKAARVWQRL